MIAQVVFDLPLDGPFDYSVPEDLISQVTPGRRVKVSFGPRPKIGFVIGLLEKSAVAKLKPILSLADASVGFNDLDLALAQNFSDYYGCSLGEALGTMLRNKSGQGPSVRRDHQPVFSLYRCHPDSYARKIQEIMDGYGPQSQFLILVPDAFHAQTLSQQLKTGIKIGTRSCVFEADGRYDCVIMVDEEDLSYKQEQMPMYETRQVLLMRTESCGFDAVFVGISPSVELMALARENRVRLTGEDDQSFPQVRLIDLSHYKYIPAMISPPLNDVLNAALKAGKKSILVLNRKGSYRLTRCVDCGEVLKCSHCDSSLVFSRAEGRYLCRHCTFSAPGDIVCPKCHKPSWRSQGIGVEQLQTELKKNFPTAKILAFERSKKTESLRDFDILISTQAVLRFQGQLKVDLAAFIDFDAELNRLDMRSAFHAFSLALHIGSMAQGMFIQTRNSHHYVLQSLSSGKKEYFYDEELKLRKELGFSPFKHWIKITWRGKSEKSTSQSAQEAYNILNGSAPVNCIITPPLADSVGRKRDLFRFNVMVQADRVPAAVAFIKSTLAGTKRQSRVIVTLNVDP